MPEINQKVVEMIRAELTKNPDTPNQELQAKAIKIDGSVAELHPRQFNARYRLLAKRLMNGPRKVRKQSKAQDKERIREILIGLIKEVAEASPGELVNIVGDIDSYVDRIK